jgi:hypothetical protein
MLKISNKLANSRTKIEKIQKPYFLAYMCSINAKNENKKSHASVPLMLVFLGACLDGENEI